MKLNELAPPKGAKKKIKRVGRGEGSGHGGTAGKGHKGQKARSGGKVRRGFEGGQMPLQRRLPKRGFINIFKKEYAILNIKDLEIFEENAVVTPEVLKEKRIIKKIGDGIKILGMGEIQKPLTVKVQKFSKSAQKKIEAQGGKIEVI